MLVLGHLMRAPALWRSPVGLGLLTRRPLDAALVRRWFQPLRDDPGVRRDLAKVLRAISTRHTLAGAEKLRGFQRPALIAWAADERVFDPVDARRLAADLPDARLEWIEGARTFVPLDQPARTAELIARFVRGDRS